MSEWIYRKDHDIDIVGIPDLENPNDRAAWIIRQLLPDVVSSTKGQISLSRLTQAQSTLDIGCGNGGYALAMRRLGAKGKLIGVDSRSANRRSKRGLYNEIIPELIQTDKALSQINKHAYDVVLGIQIPQDAITFVYHNRRILNLSPSGIILLVTEDERTQPVWYPDFQLYRGNLKVDKTILVYPSSM